MILSKLFSPGTILTSSHSYTASYLHMYFIPPLKSSREQFFTTSKEQGDLTTCGGKSQTHNEQPEPGDEGHPNRHFANRQGGHLLDTHPTTHPQEQDTRPHPLQYMYHQLQLEILKQHQELGRMGSNPCKINPSS